MPPTHTEPAYSGDWLKFEEPNHLYSRDQVTILAGGGADRVLTSGMVLGQITVGGKYIQFDEDGVAGEEAAAGVLLFDTTAPDGVDVEATIIKRHAIVAKNGITWPATADAGEIAAATAELVALGILVREDA